MKKVQGIIFLVLIIFAINLKAETSNTIGTPFIRNYTVEEYNSDSQNWMAVQDKRGVMYFANNACLLEFDGKNWTRINMPNNSVVRSLVIHDGTIFVGAVGEFGYLAFDHSGKLTYVSLTDQLPEKDKDFSNVWNTHATTHGIYFRTNSKIFRYYNQKIEIIPVATIAESETFHDGVLINKVDGGVYTLRDGHFQLLPHTQEFIRDTGRIFFLPYSDNKMLISTRNKGFFIYDLEMLLDNGSFVSNFSDQNIPSIVIKKFPTQIDAFLAHHQLYAATRINDTQFAFGTTKGGIIIMDHEGKLIQVINKNRGLQNNTINYLFVDETQNLWVATNNGISYIEISSPITQFNELNGLEERIQTLTHHRGKIYVTTRNYFLFLPEYKLNILNDNYKFMNVHNYYGDLWGAMIKDNILFTCGWDDVDNERFRINYKEKIVIIRRNIYCLGQSKKFPDHVFLGLRGGFAAAEIKSAEVLKCDVLKPSDPIDPAEPKYIDPENFKDIKYIIRRIESDPNGDLWLTTRYNGILYIRFNSNDITDYHITHYNKTHGLPRLDWNYVFLFNDQYIVDTREGIYKAVFGNDFSTNPESVKFVPSIPFGKEYAEQYRNITEMIFEDSSKIWIRSGPNIVTLNKALDGSYSWNDIPFKKINLRRARVNFCLEKSGIVWIPTLKGLMRYDSRVEKDYKAGYHALIRKVIVNNDTDVFNGAYYDPVRKSGDYFTISSLIQPQPLIPRLSYENNSLTFEYTTTFYEHAEHNRFQYILEGFDKDWSDWTAETHKEYTNLNEGEYCFKVKAKNIFEYESTEASYSFSISPPWHRTIFAYFGYGFMFLLIFFGGIRLNSRRLVAAKHRLEKIVDERTAEVNQQKDQLEEAFSQLAVANKKLEKLARTDGLTGLFNYRHFDEFLDLEWKRTSRSGKPISVILADIDFFKFYNDTYGHQAGDESLKKVATVLDEVVNRPGDLVARYGGEEFVIVLSDTDSQGAGFIAEQIRVSVESLEIVHEESPISNYVTISVGCATTIPQKDMDSSTLIRAADQALYQSKQKGRNRITVAPDL